MNTPPVVNGQMGTVNSGQQMVGMMPDMGPKPRRKKRGKKNEIAAVVAFKKLMRTR